MPLARVVPASRRQLLIAAIAAALTILAAPRPPAHGTAPPSREATPARAGRMLVVYDLEGAAGVVDAATMDPSRPAAFARGRASLVAEVNAVVAGLFDAGATVVDVMNAHGYGGDSLVPREALDRRAGIVSRASPNAAYNPDAGLPQRGYVAVAVVAMHDKPRSGGFSPHTLGAGLSPVVNGATVTETELVGYAFGTTGIPVILASGDDRLGRTLVAAMPWLEYVVTKRALAPMSAEARDQDVVVTELRAASARAVRALGVAGRMRPMTLAGPTRVGLLPTFPAWLPRSLGSIPGLDRRGDTLTFVAPDYPTAWRGTMALVTLAAGNRRGLVLGQLQDRPDARAALAATQDSLDALWIAFEAGRWQPQ